MIFNKRQYRLYIASTDVFNEYEIISSKAKRTLEKKYMSVSDRGLISIIKTPDKDNIFFRHQYTLKSIPIKQFEPV